MIRQLVLLVMISVIFLNEYSLADYTVQECLELGFIKPQLLCSNCNKLDEYKLEPLKEDCFQCCQKDQSKRPIKKYPKAILEICTCKFGAYPQIQAFIKSDRPSKFPNLQIKYVRGLDPTIKLLDKMGNVKETLSITKWNTDTVEEYFDTILEKNEKKVNNKVNNNKIYNEIDEDDEEDDDDIEMFFKTNFV